MRLSSKVFHVTSNGPPNGPDPPWILTPPLIVEKWICTFMASFATTPPLIVAVWTAFSSLPNTTVAPRSTTRPPVIVTGPSLKQAPSSGTTTRPYVPGASSPSQDVTALAPTAEGAPTANA